MMTFSKIYSGISALFVVILCLAVVNLSLGQQRMCGPGLRQAMEMVCPNGFASYVTKRSSMSLDEDMNSENMDDEFNFGLSLDMLPFLTNQENSENSGLAKIRRRRHGVAHECCLKPCRMSEMRAYCRD